MLTILRKSFQMYDRNWVVFKGTKCGASRSMRWSGESSCQRLRRRQCILDKISNVIGVQPWIQDFEQVDISQILILDHKGEIFGISKIEWNTTPWVRTTLRHDRAIKLSKAMVHDEHILSRYGTGKTKLDGSWILVNIVNWMESTGRVRVEYFPMTHNIGTAPWDSTEDGRKQNQAWGIQRSNHLHVDVQWHRLDERWKPKHVCFEFCRSSGLRTQIPEGTLVIPPTKNRRKNGMECTLTSRTVCGTNLQRW